MSQTTLALVTLRHLFSKKNNECLVVVYSSITAIGGNSSGNVSQWATTRPSLVTGGSVRPSTVNAGNRTGNVSLSATTRLLLVTPSSPPATVNAGNRTGNVSQPAPTRPPLVAPTRWP